MIVTDMKTEKAEKHYESAEDAAAHEFGAFVDEVLNAGWTPQPEARRAVRRHLDSLATVACEPDVFLRNLYACQE